MESLKKYWYVFALIIGFVVFNKRKTIRKKVRNKVVRYKKIKNAYSFMRNDIGMNKIKALKTAYKARYASGRDGNTRMW